LYGLLGGRVLVEHDDDGRHVARSKISGACITHFLTMRIGLVPQKLSSSNFFTSARDRRQPQSPHRIDEAGSGGCQDVHGADALRQSPFTIGAGVNQQICAPSGCVTERRSGVREDTGLSPSITCTSDSDVSASLTTMCIRGIVITWRGKACVPTGLPSAASDRSVGAPGTRPNSGVLGFQVCATMSSRRRSMGSRCRCSMARTRSGLGAEVITDRGVVALPGSSLTCRFGDGEHAVFGEQPLGGVRIAC